MRNVEQFLKILNLESKHRLDVRFNITTETTIPSNKVADLNLDEITICTDEENFSAYFWRGKNTII